jgi:hypothetical protein
MTTENQVLSLSLESLESWLAGTVDATQAFRQLEQLAPSSAYFTPGYLAIIKEGLLWIVSIDACGAMLKSWGLWSAHVDRKRTDVLHIIAAAAKAADPVDPCSLASLFKN